MKSCPKCGRKNDDEAKFCDNCGAALKVLPKKRLSEDISSAKKLLIVAFLVFGAVLLLFMGFNAIMNPINSNSSNSNQFVTGDYNNSGVYFVVPDGWKAKAGNSSYIAMAFKNDTSTVRLFLYKYDNETSNRYVEEQSGYFEHGGENPLISSTQKYQKIMSWDNAQKKDVIDYVFQKGTSVYVLEFSSDYSFYIDLPGNNETLRDIDKMVESFNVT